MALAKKLYFDIINLTSGGSSVEIRLTEESATQPTATMEGSGIPVGLVGSGGDRFGNLLPQLPALNGNSPGPELARAEITAIFVLGDSGSPAAPGVTVNFTKGESATVPKPLTPFYTQGTTGLVTVPTKAGASASFVTHPRVKLSTVGGSGSVSGTLYIQRQHSIEV